jgi:hypothetical protein
MIQPIVAPIVEASLEDPLLRSGLINSRNTNAPAKKLKIV